MKKTKIIAICSLCLLFLGCNSKELTELKNNNRILVKENNELKNKNQELTESIKEFYSLNYDFDDKNEYKIHDLSFTLNFYNGGYDTKVFAEKNIYTIQKGDSVDVIKFIHDEELNKNFIAVRVNNNFDGFIKIRGNPYENGNFEFAETIIVDETEITILKYKAAFQGVDGIFIKEFPSESSKNLHEITHEEGCSFESLNITSDYKWVKIKVGNFVGWVPSKHLSANRGGPTLNTPEEYIDFSLIGCNGI